MNINKEEKKLADLEFEYNIARISKQDEDIISSAKGKYIKQLNKVLRYKKTVLLNKKNEDSVNILEDLI